jgi:hypothetical protein
MSSSFLNSRGVQVPTFGCVASLVGVLYGHSVSAADTYLTPGVEVGAEYHTNLRLQRETPSDEDESGDGYFADLSVIAGIRSPRAFVELKPRVRFQEFPDHDEMERSNEYADLRTGYQTLRSALTFVGNYQREDQVRAEVSDAEFDDFDPDDPIVDESGRVDTLRGQRTRIQFRPDYEYQFSQRVGVGATAVYQIVDYDIGDASRQDYDYWRADGFFTWSLGPRTRLRTGAYATEFETDTGFNLTQSVGGSLGIEHQWSETFTATASIDVEQADVEREDLAEKESSTDTGFTVGLQRRDLVSELRVDAGRTFNPTGNGVRSEVDQVRMQYDRNLTERLRLLGAGRAYRSRAQGGAANGSDRDYIRTDIGLGWNMTRTWSIEGRYSYIWEEFENETGDRSDNMLTLSIRYRALQPQR